MRSLTAVLVSGVLATALVAQAPSMSIDYVQFFPGGFLTRIDTAGPPLALFTVYGSFQSPYTTPFEQLNIFELYSGQLDNSGHQTVFVPINGPSALHEIWFAAFEVEMVSLDLHVTPPVAASGKVDAPPTPPPPPCVSNCAMAYNPTTCTVILKGVFCPGFVIELKVNGVTVMTSTGSTSGVVVMGNGALCLGAGDVLTANVNGVESLGPIHG